MENVKIKKEKKMSQRQIELEKQCVERWLTHVLAPNNIKINDICNDFKNGVNLIFLIQALTGEKPPRFHANPRNPVQMGENINTAIRILESKKVNLFSPNSENIRDGNLRELLSLFTAIFNDLYAGIKKIPLISWVKKTLSDASALNISNNLSNWKDGVTLCALLSKIVPSSIDFSSIDKDDAVKIAFDTLRNNGIFCLLSPEEFSEGNERAIFMQLVEIYKLANGSASNSSQMPMSKPVVQAKSPPTPSQEVKKTIPNPTIDQTSQQFVQKQTPLEKKETPQVLVEEEEQCTGVAYVCESDTYSDFES